MPGPLSLVTEAQRQRERAAQIRLMAGIERAAAVRFAREFQRLANVLAAMYRDFAGNLPLLDDAMAEHKRRLTVILDRLYREAGGTLAARVRASAGKSAGVVRTKQDDEQQASLFDLAMRQFIEGRSGERIQSISEATLDSVRVALATISATGIGEVEAAKIIEQATGGLIGRRRAERIARTEGHTSSQFAGQAQIDQLGLDYRKRWVSTQDARTRDRKDAFNHRGANGQTVPRNEQFKIEKLSGGFELMDFPGDPSGSKGNVINCRCVQVYEVL